MANPKNRLPDCGLYRATRALPGHEDRIPAGSIVYFHNHPTQGGQLPTVLAPDHNMLNSWHFHGPPFEVRGLSWAESLELLPKEGYYVLRRDFDFGDGIWPKNSLVQLGYTQTADPILFIAKSRAKRTENDLFFSDRGAGLTREQLSILEPVMIFEEPPEGDAPDHTHD